MINKDFNSIIELLKTFPTEQSCIDHLTELRWNGNVVSPFDSTSQVYSCKENKYRCRNTGKYFNVRTGTLFDNTKVPLQKWFLAIWIATSHKKGISSIQLSKDIDVTQKTAWFMLQRIRNCFGFDNEGKLDNQVEVDETFIGGKNKNRHQSKKVELSQGRSVKDKSPVVGFVEREGKLIAKQVEDTKLETLTTEVVKRVKESASVFTDEWLGYNALQRIYDHSVIKHKANEYVNGHIHTNTIEGFWSLLKRGIVGIYHFTTKKHLQKYVDEFVFRYNTRKFGESQRFNLLLANTEYRLTYKELIND
ncbi:MAG TPA: IS1595 family transposase [Prolixibacteraceae bacterium]|nr:IS1595 family transposase [Prolixibacteraceae bacterium]